MGAPAKSSPGRTEQWIGDCLERLDGQVTRTGFGRWRFARPEEGKARTSVTFAHGWLVVERRLAGCKVTRLDRMLRRTRPLLEPGFSLPSGGRAVLPAGETEVWIRAERPVLQPARDTQAPLGRWVRTACADAAAGAGGGRKPTRECDREDAEAASDKIQADIRELCDLAGWSAAVRGTSGEVAVALPARDGGVCQALATPEGGAVRIRVELGIGGGGENTPACRAAVVILLLRVAGSVRLVRSSARYHAGQVAAALEVCLQPPVGIETLGHALSALTLAHQQAVSEWDAIAGDDSLARTYLVLQGAS